MPVFDLAARRQRDHGQARLHVLDCRENLHTAASRKHQVEDDEVDVLGEREFGPARSR